jgi:hypothetical protein
MGPISDEVYGIPRARLLRLLRRHDDADSELIAPPGQSRR